MEEEPRNKEQILARIETARHALQATLGAQEMAALVAPGPNDGWSVKDHIAHIAAWERYLAALLTGGNRWTEMGLTEAPTPTEEYAINEAIYERTKDLSLAQVYAGWDAAHRHVLDALAGLTDADLLLPFSHYAPDATGAGAADPIYGWVNGNTWGHYEEHAAWIAEDLARNVAALDAETEDAPATVADLIAANDAVRRELLALLEGLDDAALSAPRPPDGWAIKDHLLHLAAWQRGIVALLDGADRWNAMGLTDAQAEQAQNADDINALLFAAGKARPAPQARAEFEAAHRAMRDALARLTDADLQRPYDDFIAGGGRPPARPPARPSSTASPATPGATTSNTSNGLRKRWSRGRGKARSAHSCAPEPAQGQDSFAGGLQLVVRTPVRRNAKSAQECALRAGTRWG